MKLGIIGCGKMGTALVEGAIRSGAVPSANITGIDPEKNARQHFQKITSAATGENFSSIAHCDVILLCTKPANAATALKATCQASNGKSQLIISIAAGVTLHALEAAAGESTRIIRAMPNTPALVGKGAAAYCLGSQATPQDAETAHKLLSSVGLAIQLPEKLMDAVTGLSGSGPAYGYLIIEALADGGVKAGLTRTDALRLAAQTIFGAAAMVLETGEHPAILKDQVTSPGGTTIAGIAELERHGVRAALMDAVTAAAHRATELGK